MPLESFAMLGHKLDRPVKMTEIGSPGAAYIDVFLIDLPMGIDGYVTGICVLADNHIGTVVPGHLQSFRHRVWITGCLILAGKSTDSTASGK